MPRYRNAHNVSRAIVEAILFDPWQGRGDITVSQLSRPPLMAYLERAHDHEIEIDVSSRLWALLGQAVHSVLERGRDPAALREEPLAVELDGWTVTGRPDLWYEIEEPVIMAWPIAYGPPEFTSDDERRGKRVDTAESWGLLLGEPRRNVLIDFKTTSVWSFLRGEKDEWTFQLNAYRYLYGAAGFDVDHQEVAAICRDWYASRAGEEDYPPSPFMRTPITIWDEEKTEQEIRKRIAWHKAARAGNPRECSDGERWAKPDTYAVMREGQKKAVAVFGDGTKRGGDRNHALALIAEAKSNGLSLEDRRGDKFVRCRQWCDAQPVCPVAKRVGLA